MTPRDPEPAVEAEALSESAGADGDGGVEGLDNSLSLRRRERELVLLVGVLAGKTVESLSAELLCSIETIQSAITRPAFTVALSQLRADTLAAVERGEAGPVSQARANAPTLLTALVHLAKSAKSEAIRRLAITDVLGIAGITSVKRVETFDVNQAINDLSPDELDRFIRDGVWPERMRDRPIARPTGLGLVTPIDAPIVSPVPAPSSPIVTDVDLDILLASPDDEG